MNRMQVLGPQGDVTITWETEDEESITKARQEFEKLQESGFEFFAIKQDGSKMRNRLKTFPNEKKRGEVMHIVAVAGAQRKRDNKEADAAGKARPRQRAMAGGPNNKATSLHLS